jgi:DNA-binding beta-propeller fold protein YncE
LNRLRRITILFTVLCAVAAPGAGCASKWALSAEAPAEPPQWLDHSDLARARHVASITGFRQTGTTIPNLLKYLVFGRTDARNELVRPVAAAVGPDGRLAIADTGCACVHLYVPTEQRYVRIHGAGREAFRSPVSAVFDKDSRLYVSDSANGAIYVFNRQGAAFYSIRQAGDAALQRPTGLSYSPDRDILYAVDTLANRVHAFTAAGALLFSFGGPGEEKGRFNFPTHVVSRPDGSVYVTDALNFRVQVFDESGAYLSSFGHHGNGSGDFSMPKGIAVDRAGVVYVVDALFDNVQLFSMTGGLLFTIGGRGTGHGEFWLPSGAFMDEQNKLYVCDTYNQRVQVFQIQGDDDD